MIFRQWEQIIGTTLPCKTQTRRAKKTGEWLAVFKDGSKAVMKNGRVKYRTGRTYPIIPKRGQKAIPDGRILLKDIREELLWQISHEDSVAEGVNSVSEYRELWDSINAEYPFRSCDNPEVWVYDFEYVETAELVKLA